MAGNSYLFIFSLLFLLGCAVPNYQEPKITPQSDESLCYQQFNICTKLLWEEKPTESTTGSFSIFFFTREQSQNGVDFASKIEVILWMPSMGHGSSPVTVQRVSNGLYKATEVFFIMPGEWQIRIQAKDENNRVLDEVIQNITI